MQKHTRKKQQGEDRQGDIVSVSEQDQYRLDLHVQSSLQYEKWTEEDQKPPQSI